MKTVGYVKESAELDTHCLDRICNEVFIERDRKRKSELVRILGNSRPGDVLVVPKLSHLATSIRDLSHGLQMLNEKRIGLHALHEDFETMDAAGHYFSRMVDVFANVEKTATCEQLSRSRSRMKVKLNGRRPKLSTADRADVVRQIAQGSSISNVARKFEISRSTVYAYLQATSKRP